MSNFKEYVKNTIYNNIYKFGLEIALNIRRYENLSPSHMRSLVKRDDPVILDVGANDGADSDWLGRLFPKGKIFSFEPDPRAIARFRKNVKRENVSLQELALGAENGVLPFHQSSGWPPGSERPFEGAEWDYSGSLHAPNDLKETHPWLKFDNIIHVPVMRLDDWAGSQNFDSVDFMWADVQGAENDLILGAGSFINNINVIYIEYSDKKEYDNQWDLDEIRMNLPNHTLFKKFRHDALFVQKKHIVKDNLFG